MKNTLLPVVAVSVALVAPLAMAESESSLVGSVRYGVALVDSGDGTDAEFSYQNFGSRIKLSGSRDLDNGMTSFGKMEIRLSDSRNGNTVNRMYAVGIKGGFGTVSLGVQDSAFDLVNPDRAWWNGGMGLVGNRIEKNGVIKYENSSGDVSVAVAATMQAGDDDADAADIVDAAIKYSANGITAGVGVQSLAGNGDPVTNDGTAFAVTGGYNFGAGDFTLTYGVEDEDYTGGAERTGIDLQAGFGDVYAWFSSMDNDGGTNPTRVGLGYTQKLGPKTLIWYEAFSTDADDGSDADIALNAVLKIDF